MIRRPQGRRTTHAHSRRGGNFYIPASEGDRSLEVSNYAALRFDVKGRPKPLRVIRLPWGREWEDGGTLVSGGQGTEGGGGV